jgi:hypothetical protein
MASSKILDGQFVDSAISIFARASQETLDAGVPIFYRDPESGMDVMERPDGSRFQVLFLSNAPLEDHYQIVRQLNRTAA